MDWMLVNSHINRTFSGLGTYIGDKYCIGPNCQEILVEILHKLTVEDCNVRSFRRAISFSQVIKKDLLSLLYNVKNDPKVIDLIVKILVNLTVPVECLLPLHIMLKTDQGRNTIYELNWLLTSCKEAFLDPRSTCTIIVYIQEILDKGDKISPDDCESINNFLLLLRNILHIPEVRGGAPGGGASHQNHIVWNLFRQHLDKVLIQLITNQNRSYWVMVMVQLIPLIYKDQHVGTLQRLLNHWFDEAMSESSDDNESNTSPQDEGSGDSSSMMTSDPTSDSSDNGGSFHRKKKIEPDFQHSTDTIENYQRIADMIAKKGQIPPHKHNTNHHKNNQFKEDNNSSDSGNSNNKNYQRIADMIAKKGQIPPYKHNTNHHKNKQVKEDNNSSDSGNSNNKTSEIGSSNQSSNRTENETSEFSDRGYGTQVENQESMSTSSNEDEGGPFTCTKPVKPNHLLLKSRYPSWKTPLVTDNNNKELRKKKLIKRSRKNCMNIKSLQHHSPTDEEISKVLKEFTIDFLLKGYGYLVSELHAQLISNKHFQIDTSHFFWLVTYFLKIVAQLEIHLNLISPVLSFDILSYLTFEGMNLCEQLEIVRSQKGDLNSCLRRIHLVVTSIKEVVQTIDVYRKITHLSSEDKEYLTELQAKILKSNDLKCLFVLLLRHFDPTIQSKQYLQDIITTNHLLLMFLEKSPHNSDELKMSQHIEQFASSDVINQYGLLLEHFEENGEFINNCIFTILHHVGGDLDRVSVLFQPSVLNAFTKIKDSNFPLCEDWLDLIEYVINKFITVPERLQLLHSNGVSSLQDMISTSSRMLKNVWSQEETDNLYWYYIQSARSQDLIGKVVEYYRESGLGAKSRVDVIEQLWKQDIISNKQFEKFMAKEPKSASRSKPEDRNKMKEDKKLDEITVLRDHLLNENKGSYIKWVQNCLLETCYARLCLTHPGQCIVEPIAHHCAILEQPTPLVTWNADQRNAMQYQPFVILLQKLGFQQPTEAGKTFACIPSIWTPNDIYSVASVLSPIETKTLKFDTSLLKLNDVEELENEIEDEIMQPNFLVSDLKVATRMKHKLTTMNCTSQKASDSNWLISVQQSKILMSAPSPMESQEDEDVENIDSDNDLGRMYVSDEEEPTSPKVFKSHHREDVSDILCDEI